MEEAPESKLGLWSPKFAELFKAHLYDRVDIGYLYLIVSGFLGGEKDLVTQAMNLFWNFYHPSAIVKENNSYIKKDLPELPENELEIVIETLDKLEKETRVPHAVDGEEDYGKLMTYLHIAACRALVLKKREGYSEDVRQVLENVWRTNLRFNAGCEYPQYDVEKEEDWSRSIPAVTSLALVELFRIRRIECKYEEALHFFALALEYASLTIYAAFGEEPIETWRLKYEKYIPKIDIDAQEVVEAFESLRTSSLEKNWRQIIEDCRLINYSWGDCLRDYDEHVTDSNGVQWNWVSFWSRAAGWAEAKLEPSELYEVMRKEEDEKAMQRIKAYFIDESLFNELSDRAKRSLIEADRVWFSSRFGRVDAIPNEIRIVIDEILFSLFWEPLCKWIDSQNITNIKLLDFQKIRNELSETHFEPSLLHFKNMLETQAFKEYLRSLALSKENEDFTLKSLPHYLFELSKPRRDKVDPIIRTG